MRNFFAAGIRSVDRFTHRWRRDHSAFGMAALVALLVAGCPETPPSVSGDSNATDPTNRGAAFIGSSACRTCHADQAAAHLDHGHASALSAIRNGAPQFSPAATRAGVPDPPQNVLWSNIAYVIGGYAKAANFIDLGGFILTDGFAGVNTQWNVAFPPGGRNAGFSPYLPEETASLAFDYSCFRCHTTGALPQDPDEPQFQDNRPGIAGTWNETGVQCEACHGPGSNHFRTVGAQVFIDRSAIFIDPTGASSCAKCHDQQSGANAGIPARDGFIEHYAQAAELRASGAHASFACTVCHDPHSSAVYAGDNAGENPAPAKSVGPTPPARVRPNDGAVSGKHAARASGIRNECRSCHVAQSMAGHEGKVLTRGDYTEPVTCQSCHMPFATRIGAAAGPDVVGDLAQAGDIRTHIFRISTSIAAPTRFLSDDGSQVLVDDAGRAAVPVTYVCLRCHNDIAAFRIRLETAAQITARIHELP